MSMPDLILHVGLACGVQHSMHLPQPLPSLPHVTHYDLPDFVVYARSDSVADCSHCGAEELTLPRQNPIIVPDAHYLEPMENASNYIVGFAIGIYRYKLIHPRRIHYIQIKDLENRNVPAQIFRHLINPHQVPDHLWVNSEEGLDVPSRITHATIQMFLISNGLNYFDDSDIGRNSCPHPPIDYIMNPPELDRPDSCPPVAHHHPHPIYKLSNPRERAVGNDQNYDWNCHHCDFEAHDEQGEHEHVEYDYQGDTNSRDCESAGNEHQGDDSSYEYLENGDQNGNHVHCLHRIHRPFERGMAMVIPGQLSLVIPTIDAYGITACPAYRDKSSNCNCSDRYRLTHDDAHILYYRMVEQLAHLLAPTLTMIRKCSENYSSRLPLLPHISLAKYKYHSLFRILQDPNGGATSAHLYMHDLTEFNSEEIRNIAMEFISLSFAEDEEDNAYHVIGVVHGGANYLPDLLDYFADHYGFITVNIGSLSGPESHAHCLSEYRDRAYRTYSNGTFRFSPLQELSICGVKGEEYGAYFPNFVQRLEASPFMGPVMPWSRSTVVATDNPRDSNDGPIFWIRPGEQTIPLTERSKRRCASDMPVVRLTEDRQALFEDRTRPHADQIGVDGKGTRDNTAPTAAVGVLKSVNCGHPEHAGRATKDVVAFHAGDYDRMQKIFSLDFYEPPLRQCHAWLDTAQLNSLRRDGLRYSRLQLHDGDIYYLPRKIVHQFQTISAVASVAWHVRFKKYFEEHGAPNLNLAKGNKGAIYYEKLIVPPYVPPPPTDDEANTEEEEPEPEEPPPPRRRRPQRPAARRGVRRKITRRNTRLQHDESDEDSNPEIVEPDDGASTTESPVKIEPEEQVDPGPSTSRRRGRRATYVDMAEPVVETPPETPSPRKGRKSRMPITAEDMPAPGVARVPRIPTVFRADDSPVCDKNERPRDLKAIKREATQEFSEVQHPQGSNAHGQEADLAEASQTSGSKGYSRSKKSINPSGDKNGKHAQDAHVNGEHSSSSRPSTSRVPKSSSALESEEPGLDIKLEPDGDETRSEIKREKSPHEDSSKRRESKSESSHSSHKSRSDKKHSDSRSSHKESDSHSSRKESDSRSSHKDNDRKRSRDAPGSSRSSHSSDDKRSRDAGAGSSRSSHSSHKSSKDAEKKDKPGDSKKDSHKSHSKPEDSKKPEDDSSHKRRHDSADRPSESKKDPPKDSRKDDKRSSEKKSDAHRHTNGSSSSSSSSHRHKSSTESRHSDKDRSSHRHNGSHSDSKVAADQSSAESAKPDSTTGGDLSSHTIKTPVKSIPDQSVPGTSQETREVRKAVKRRMVPRPPPPTGNVIGEIMAQMDKQRQM